MSEAEIVEEKYYAIELWTNPGPGASLGRWVTISHELFISRELASDFRAQPNDENLALKALSELSKARPYEKFRLVHKTKTIISRPSFEVPPRVILGPEDIERFLDGENVDEKGRDTQKAMAHDGFRSFNGVRPAMSIIRLNPFCSYAYRESVVREALRQWRAGEFEDIWVPLYPGSPKADEHSVSSFAEKMKKLCLGSVINFAQQVEIRAESYGFGDKEKIIYKRTYYGEPGVPADVNYYDSLDEAKAGVIKKEALVE